MRLKLVPVYAFILLVSSSQVFADSFSSLTVFGDSLSDNGNAFLLSNGLFPGANYGTYTFANGLSTQYFSDGPNTSPAAAGAPGLWADKFAGKLGVPDPTPAIAGGPTGTNYAVAGADTGTTNQDVGVQVGAFTSTHPSGASPTSLYAFWAGANDIFDGKNAVQAADNIAGYITALHSQGAVDFLWLNLPLLGDVPRGQSDHAALNAASVAFNDEWAKDIAALQGSGISVTGVNIEGLFTGIISNPSKYGLTNATTPAQGLNIPTDAGYLFWDVQHPTTAGQTLVADAVEAAVATPEPASFGLAVMGVLAAAFYISRYRASRANI
jgi:phospholipase/lecithinase/hemolysin